LPSTHYNPTWNSLDKRPIPAWYDKAKFGIFMHWGVFSVPSFGSEWFWKFWHDKDKPYVDFVNNNYPPRWSYADFAPQLTAEFFDANEWADLLSKSGAKYFVFTSKHHEGWTNWPSKQAWNWNSVENGPHRDIVGELAKAVRNKTNVSFGLYFSLFEFYHPYYLEDLKNNYTTHKYVDEVMLPQMYDLINTYEPSYLWTDGDWVAPNEYFRSREFLAWLYNDSPVKDYVVVNDRWGANTRNHHAGVYTGSDKYNPGVLQKHKFEDATTVDKRSWGYRREMKLSDVQTIDELLELMVTVVSCGGNFLLNIGPTKEGTIPTIFEERLLQIGAWLHVNGEAIYDTVPWRVQNDTANVPLWYTRNPDTNVVYAIALEWPTDPYLKLASPITTDATIVTLLGNQGEFVWESESYQPGVIINLPYIPASALPCQWAWVFKLESVM
ncbi:predicted protein, partial [Nematostella vectensis]